MVLGAASCYNQRRKMKKEKKFLILALLLIIFDIFLSYLIIELTSLLTLDSYHYMTWNRDLGFLDPLLIAIFSLLLICITFFEVFGIELFEDKK